MRKALGLSLVAVVGLASGQAVPLQAGDRPVPKEIAQARYVALGFDLGNALLAESAPDDARILPGDRQTLAALRAEIERWGRYKVVAKPEQGELFIAIRTGRQGVLGGGGGLEVGGLAGGAAPGGPAAGRAPSASSRSLGMEASSSEDALFVYGNMSGGTPLWRGQMSRGLQGSPPPLFERFRADVERAAK